MCPCEEVSSESQYTAILNPVPALTSYIYGISNLWGHTTNIGWKCQILALSLSYSQGKAHEHTSANLQLPVIQQIKNRWWEVAVTSSFQGVADSVTNIIHNDERSNVFPLKLVTRQDACSHHLYSVQYSTGKSSQCNKANKVQKKKENMLTLERKWSLLVDYII